MKHYVFVLIFLSISTPIEACFATRNAANAVVGGDDDNSSSSTEEPVTDAPTDAPTDVPTDAPITDCNPTSLQYATGEEPSTLEVTYFDYTSDGTTASMSVTCTVKDTTLFAQMSFINPDNQEIQSVESQADVTTVTATLTCSLDTNLWEYTQMFEGQSYSITVTQVLCVEGLPTG